MRKRVYAHIRHGTSAFLIISCSASVKSMVRHLLDIREKQLRTSNFSNIYEQTRPSWQPSACANSTTQEKYKISYSGFGSSKQELAYMKLKTVGFSKKAYNLCASFCRDWFNDPHSIWRWAIRFRSTYAAWDLRGRIGSNFIPVWLQKYRAWS